MKGIPGSGTIKETPYWWEAAPRPDAEPVELPATADVGIVGGGFTGLTAALTLARAGRSVVVFDAMRAGEGASSRNGGITSGNIKRAFGAMIETYGLEEAMALYHEGVAARESLARFIEDEGIECGYAMNGRFTGCCSPHDYERLGREAGLMNKHLGIGVEMVPKAEQHRELGTDVYFGGQVRHDIGGLHPGLFHLGIYERAMAAGVTFVGETRVEGIRRDSAGNRGAFTFKTTRGEMTAGEALVATNGYTDAAMKWLNRRIISIPSQIIATEEIPAETMARLMPKKRMLGNTRNLYNYYRPSPDGTRILMGGRGGAHTDDVALKARHLYANMVEIFPELDGVGLTHCWWGYTGYTFDFLPKLFVNDGIHYACGFNGSGVVWAPWLGRKAALKIAGNAAEADTPFARHGFETRPLYFGTPWFLPWVIRWYALKDRFGFGR